VSTASRCEHPPRSLLESAALAEYADRLLLGTGLTLEDAIAIAGGRLEAAPELRELQAALREAWQLEADQS
jgi:hypothetical protein